MYRICERCESLEVLEVYQVVSIPLVTTVLGETQPYSRLYGEEHNPTPGIRRNNWPVSLLSWS